MESVCHEKQDVVGEYDFAVDEYEEVVRCWGKVCRSRGRQKVIDSSSNLGRREYNENQAHDQLGSGSERVTTMRGAGEDVCRIPAASSSSSSM